MNRHYFLSIFSIALAASLMLPAPAQERGKDETTRQAFLVTRPKPAGGKPGTPGKRPSAGKTGAAQKATWAPLGLGYTLYQKDASGHPVRVDAAREFRAGDEVRLVIEANTDGYLYVFTAENGRDLQMIFPDWRLNGGDNRIAAHVPYEVPSSQEADPRFQWFYFNQQAATEHLYVILSREPLPAVLAGNRLVAHCRANPRHCPWRPSETAWRQLAARADTLARMSQSRAAGQAQTPDEAAAISRGLGLPPGAPAPSMVKMNVSAKAGLIMVRMELIHKE
jgi:hypothetical protein